MILFCSRRNPLLIPLDRTQSMTFGFGVVCRCPVDLLASQSAPRHSSIGPHFRHLQRADLPDRSGEILLGRGDLIAALSRFDPGDRPDPGAFQLP